MTKYIHKNKEFFNALCNIFPSFSKRFQEACNIQIDNELNYVIIGRERVSKDNFYWAVDIPKSDIEVKKDLKPYVWYDRSEFDENPNNYALVEKVIDDYDYLLYTTINKINIHSLCPATTKFMYIERPK